MMMMMRPDLKKKGQDYTCTGSVASRTASPYLDLSLIPQDPDPASLRAS